MWIQHMFLISIHVLRRTLSLSTNDLWIDNFTSSRCCFTENTEHRDEYDDTHNDNKNYGDYDDRKQQLKYILR